MPTPFTQLQLGPSQVKILKRIRRKKSISKAKVDGNPEYDFLRKYSLIDYADPEHLHYKLSDKAQMYLRYKKSDDFRFWFPNIISVIALIISIIAITSNCSCNL